MIDYNIGDIVSITNKIHPSKYNGDRGMIVDRNGRTLWVNLWLCKKVIGFDHKEIKLVQKLEEV